MGLELADMSLDWNGLESVWGPAIPRGRPPRLLGLFAHPDDEVFCAGGTLARCAARGAETAVLSLTRGEAGRIRDAATATRRTLGAVRADELVRAAKELGVEHVACLDLGDGHLTQESRAELVATARAAIERFEPDVVVTFGPEGAFEHPDHVMSCLATMEAIDAMAEPPRLLHARFPDQDQFLVGLLVEWLTSKEQRFRGTAAFAHALRLFADGSSMLGFAADYLDVDWFPAGSFVIEQGEPAAALYCILSGSLDIVVESDDGSLHRVDTVGAGCFVGEEALATGRPRNAHVIAREDSTCLVLATEPPTGHVARGPGTAETAGASTPIHTQRAPGPVPDGCFAVDVRSTLDRKVAALAAHHSQYALDTDLLPRSMLECLLGTEYFAVARAGWQTP